MSDKIICKCGHSINSHSTHSITYGIHAGCQDASFCDCELTPQDVAAAELERYETARQEDARRLEQGITAPNHF